MEKLKKQDDEEKEIIKQEYIHNEQRYNYN